MTIIAIPTKSSVPLRSIDSAAIPSFAVSTPRGHHGKALCEIAISEENQCHVNKR